MRTGGRTAGSHARARSTVAIAWLSLAAPLSPLACGPARATARPASAPDPAATPMPLATSLLRLSEVQQKATHNSYERDERIGDQLAAHRIRAVEIDVHVGKSFRRDVSGDWYVYHVDLPGFGRTSCDRLSGCLAEIGAYHRATPGHDLISVFVDLKDGFDEAHAPADLDARLDDALGAGSLYRPADALARCAGATTLSDAVARCGWPTLGELAGRVLVAVTGGTLCDEGPVAEYAADDGAPRAAFAAPNLDASCPLVATQAWGGGVGLANLAFGERGRVPAARAAGVLTRVYYGGLGGGLDDPTSWAAAAAAGASYLATDEVDEGRSPWASTTSGPGVAFRVIALPPRARGDRAALAP